MTVMVSIRVSIKLNIRASNGEYKSSPYEHTRVNCSCY